MLDPAGQALATRLSGIIARGGAGPADDAEFGALALAIFAYQFERNDIYGAYCRRRGHTPATVRAWEDIPAVPAAAFREARLCTVAPGQVEAIFRTSGTTNGEERRGEHHVADLALYERSLLESFESFVLPDGARLPVLSLVPPAELARDSSLAHMAAIVTARLGAGGRSYVGPAAGVDIDTLLDRLRAAAADGEPVLLFGTVFAFVHLLDAMAAGNARVTLPDGSRIMDTGGYKGRSREVPASELRRSYRERLGVPDERCVNEYGMTEMLSQFYEPALRAGGVPASHARHKVGPPWVRTLAVDPETLAPLPSGRTGILRHIDLANIGSVSALQTEDLGRIVEGRLDLLGRAPGATPRGCSIAMDLLLRARGPA